MIGSFVLGIYPRSPKLIQATRKGDPGLPSIFKAEKRKLISIQRRANLSYICDPMLDWNDMFRPFASLDGVTLGGLNRFYETNMFYRKLIISEQLGGYGSIVRSNLALSLLLRKPLAACMPDPFTFADLNENRFYKDQADYLFAIASMLNREAQTIAKAGISLIQLNAPSIASKAGSMDIGMIKDAVELVKRNVRSKVYLHLYFGDVSKIFDKLLEIKVDGLNIDLSTTRLESISNQRVDKGLCLGAIDAMNTKMEDVRQTSRLVSGALERMQPKEAYLSATCDLEFLPYEYAVKKISRLAKIARSVRYG